MATTADSVTLQPQIRQEMADSWGYELGAVQKTCSTTAKPYRISDLIPKSWDSSHDKGQFRNFIAKLHLWMQTWSDRVSEPW